MIAVLLFYHTLYHYTFYHLFDPLFRLLFNYVNMLNLPVCKAGKLYREDVWEKNNWDICNNIYIYYINILYCIDVFTSIYSVCGIPRFLRVTQQASKYHKVYTSTSIYPSDSYLTEPVASSKYGSFLTWKSVPSFWNQKI